MSEMQDAIADVVAKMRRFADRHWMHPSCQVVREFADMLDSALKRDREVVVSKNATTTNESLVVGNAAKMHEAVKYAKLVLCSWKRDAPYRAWDEYDDAIAKCNEALAAPQRNCDKYPTPMGLRMAFLHFCKKQNLCTACPFWEGTKCEFQFALATTEKGEVRQ